MTLNTFNRMQSFFEKSAIRTILRMALLLPVLLCLSATVKSQTIVYSQSFINGSVPTTQCPAWTTFLSRLLPTYSYGRFNISGNLNPTGYTCTNPTVAAAIATAMRTGFDTALISDGHTWRVGAGCGSGCGMGTTIVELAVDQDLCSCESVASVRPAIGNANWGGMGATCFAASQTLTVTFYYGLFFFNPSPQPFSVCENSVSNSINSLLTIVDTTGLTATWSILSGPVHGTISGLPFSAPTGFDVSPTGVTYTPSLGYSGPDSLKVQASDGVHTTSTTIIVTVNPLTSILPGPILGPSAVCIGSSISLTDAVAGGTWSSSNLRANITGGHVTGISPGLDTIRYSFGVCPISATVSRIISVDTVPVLSPLAGPSIVCAEGSVTLTDSVTGGIWNSVFTTIATVSGTGIVEGLTAGIDTISYTVTNSCGTATVKKTISVNPLPVAGAISGTGSVCVGATITLTDTSPGGIWSSLYTGIATVSAGGLVMGVSAGIDSIKYSVTNICGTDNVFHTVTVNPLPYAGTISGSDSICRGDTSSMINTVTGGDWYISDPTIATISGTGLISGISVGTDIVWYIITNTCGSDTSSFPLVVELCLAGVKTIGMQSTHIDVYPDPATNTLNITSSDKINQITFTNILMQVVFCHYYNTRSVQAGIAELTPGIYFIRINGTEVRKFIKD